MSRLWCFAAPLPSGLLYAVAWAETRDEALGRLKAGDACWSQPDVQTIINVADDRTVFIFTSKGEADVHA